MTGPATPSKEAVRILVQCTRHKTLVGYTPISTPRRNHRLGLPGGRVQPGETARAAAKRELFEETGLVVDESRLFLEKAWLSSGEIRSHETARLLVQKYLFITALPLEQALEQGFNPHGEGFKRMEPPAGNEGEIVHFLRPEQMYEEIHGKQFVSAHRQYLVSSIHNCMEHIKQGRLLSPH